jgi:AcrR family transcriptional regulator
MPAPRRPFPAERKRGLSREAIVDTAMRVLDAEGLDAVTMRRVAQELGTGPASLYAHVANKEDLFALLIDRAVGEIEIPAGDGDWQEQVKQFARAMREMFVRHRDLARANMGVVPTGPNALRASDRMLGVLRGAGLPDQVCAWALDLLSLYCTAIAVEDGMVDNPWESEEYHEQVHETFTSLPPDQYPNLAALAQALVTGDERDRFEFGLDVLVSGLAATARAR